MYTSATALVYFPLIVHSLWRRDHCWSLVRFRKSNFCSVFQVQHDQLSFTHEDVPVHKYTWKQQRYPLQYRLHTVHAHKKSTEKAFDLSVTELNQTYRFVHSSVCMYLHDAVCGFLYNYIHKHRSLLNMYFCSACSTGRPAFRRWGETWARVQEAPSSYGDGWVPALH